MDSLKELEKKISERLSDFYLKEMGLEPASVKTAVQEDLLISRFENALSPSEINLFHQEAGRRLIKEMNEKLAQEILPELQKVLYPLTGKKAVGLEIELHERGREKVFLITLESPIDVASSGNKPKKA